MTVRSESRVLGDGGLLLAAAVRGTEKRRVERMAPRRAEVVTMLTCQFAGLTKARTTQVRGEKKVSGTNLTSWSC